MATSELSAASLAQRTSVEVCTTFVDGETRTRTGDIAISVVPAGEEPGKIAAAS
jgi:hypothetical protein